MMYLLTRVVKCFGAVFPYRAFLLFHVEKIRPCKTLSANVLKNFLKKVSKRFGNNVILYISLHR